MYFREKSEKVLDCFWNILHHLCLVQALVIFNKTQPYLTFCDPMDFSKPGFPVPHHLSELAQALRVSRREHCPFLQRGRSKFKNGYADTKLELL